MDLSILQIAAVLISVALLSQMEKYECHNINALLADWNTQIEKVSYYFHPANLPEQVVIKSE